jgi:hypothetical protein
VFGGGRAGQAGSVDDPDAGVGQAARPRPLPNLLLRQRRRGHGGLVTAVMDASHKPADTTSAIIAGVLGVAFLARRHRPDP